MADSKRQVVRWRYVGARLSVVEVQNPACSPDSFTLTATAFEEMRQRNPDIIFKYDRSRTTPDAGMPKRQRDPKVSS